MALLRRWYVLVLGLAIATAGTYGVWVKVGPRYGVEGSILMLPPISSVRAPAPGTPEGNPLMLVGGLGPARDALIAAMGSDSVSHDFEARFPGATYSLTPYASSSAPIIGMTVEAAKPDVALAGSEYVEERVGSALGDLQRDLEVSKEVEIRTISLTRPVEAKLDSRTRLRAAGIVGAGLLAMTLFGIGLLDGLLMTRRGRVASTTHSPTRESRRLVDPENAVSEGVSPDGHRDAREETHGSIAPGDESPGEDFKPNVPSSGRPGVPMQ